MLAGARMAPRDTKLQRLQAKAPQVVPWGGHFTHASELSNGPAVSLFGACHGKNSESAFVKL